ncbi:YjbQ family protein [Candidatus Nitrosocosmicus sp. T]
MLSRITPNNIQYEHDNTWHNRNEHSHVRASLSSPSITIPFKNGHLDLGLWQQIVFLEIDKRPRECKIMLDALKSDLIVSDSAI